MPFKGKKILVGITAGIAAYKAAIVVRELAKNGAHVKVVMTPDATAFVTPLTLATLSGNAVNIDFFDAKTGVWANHVDLGLWADLMLIAPLTANSLAKMATGICDNLLLATYLSAKCPIMFAAAMDLDMYAHETTQQNIQKLISRGHHFIKPGTGALASGLSGEGRMAEVEEIVNFVQDFFEEDLPLKGKKVMVSAGPTYEKIDSVRFIGNFSSGKMGYELANVFAEKGAEVFLIAGPGNQVPKFDNIHVTRIISALDMLNACVQISDQMDYIVMAAAIADFRPHNPIDKKIKKAENKMLQIDLEPTKDVLKFLGSNKKPNQCLIGFALEDSNELSNAIKKIESKNLDFIVLNSLNDNGAGFEHDTNKVTLIDKNKRKVEFGLANKYAIASQIVNHILSEHI
jgi:phosphopantothenoylcysteine decarboxylase/phosphopantothenate--cysteine ligase